MIAASNEDELARVVMYDGRWFHCTDVLGMNDIENALLSERGMPVLFA